MKGKILGFTPSTGAGAIAGEDGARYGFSQAEWRSDKAIAAGGAVDFQPRGGEAVGIYPVTATATATAADVGVDVAALASSPVVAKARSLARETLAFPLAIVLLITCFMPAINSVARNGQGLSLLGLGPVVSELSGEARAEREEATSQARDFTEREQQLQKAIAETGPGTPIGMFGSGGSAGDALKELQNERAKAAARRHGHVGAFLLSFMWLVYAAPLLALTLIAFSWTGRPLRSVSLAAGLSALIAFGLIWNLTTLASVGAEAMLTLGLGAWILLLAGIALILAGLGKITNPFAKAS